MKNVKKFRVLHLMCALLVIAPPLTAQTWSGWYLGGNTEAGLGSFRTTTTIDEMPFGYFSSSSRDLINMDGAPQDLDVEGFTLGIQGGFQQQRGSFVWGFEVDLAATGRDERVQANTVYSCCAPDSYILTQGYETGLKGSFRPRIGWANHRVFVFAAAGIVALELETIQTFTDDFQDASQSNSQESTETAFIYGAGIEFKINKNWSLKLEYLLSEFDEIVQQTTEIETDIGTFSEIFTHTSQLDQEVGRAGLNFQF